MKELLDQLPTEFGDKEYAHAYIESHTVSRLAAQVYTLRKRRQWSQEELSKRAGIAQERLSKIESADFESLTMKTLQKLSRAFDVSLRIAFEPFSHSILDVANLTRERLEVKSREDDLAHFSDHNQTMIIQRNGAWQAIKTDHLAVVKTFTPDHPLTPGSNWQKLSMVSVDKSIQEVAA